MRSKRERVSALKSWICAGGQVIAQLRFEISNAPLLRRLNVLKVSAAGNISAHGRPRQREHGRRHADLAGISLSELSILYSSMVPEQWKLALPAWVTRPACKTRSL